MTPQARQAAAAYAQVGVRTAAMSADPHRLIVMLFDGAHSALARAGHALANGDQSQRAVHIGKAIDIIERGLRASLDLDRGGEIAERLDSLYGYLTRRLLQANLRGDAEIVAEVDRLLADISSAWKEIGAPRPVGS